MFSTPARVLANFIGLAPDPTAVRHLAPDLGLALACAGKLTVALANSYDLPAAGELIRDLQSTLDFAYNLQTLLAVLEPAPSPARLHRPAALAGQLLTAAARLLPTAERDRYLEEFRAELADVAQARCGHWAHDSKV